MMKKLMYLAIVSLIVGAPGLVAAKKWDRILEVGTGEYTRTHIFPSPYDKVWHATVNAFQAYPITTIEKDSGILVSGQITGTSNSEYRIRWVSHGEGPPNTIVLYIRRDGLIAGRLSKERQANIEIPKTKSLQYNVRVAKDGPSSTRVTINLISKIGYTMPAYASSPDSPRIMISEAAQHEFETASIGYYEALTLHKIAGELVASSPSRFLDPWYFQQSSALNLVSFFVVTISGNVGNSGFGKSAPNSPAILCRVRAS